jgi:outer membrane biosynthesis protein TonB
MTEQANTKQEPTGPAPDAADASKPTAAPQPQPAPKPEPDVQKPGERRPAEGKTGAEAAKWRHRLREVESERDSLLENLKTQQAQAFARSITDTLTDGAALAHPDDLERFTGKHADDYYKDGQLDAEQLQADLAQLHETRPELFAKRNYSPRPDPSQGHTGGELTGAEAWQQAFQR